MRIENIKRKIVQLVLLPISLHFFLFYIFSTVRSTVNLDHYCVRVHVQSYQCCNCPKQISVVSSARQHDSFHAFETLGWTEWNVEQQLSMANCQREFSARLHILFAQAFIRCIASQCMPPADRRACDSVDDGDNFVFVQHQISFLNGKFHRIIDFTKVYTNARRYAQSEWSRKCASSVQFCANVAHSTS